jgi:hypothetical protein
MSSNIPPNGHSHINDRMAQAIRQREAQLRQALGQIQQMSLALKSVSTLAALYKAHLIALKDFVALSEPFEDGETISGGEEFQKVEKLLAAGHMEPVNEIIKLTIEATKDKALIDAQKNMIEQVEAEVKNKTAEITDRLREIETLEEQIRAKNAKITELGGYVGDI